VEHGHWRDATGFRSDKIAAQEDGPPYPEGWSSVRMPVALRPPPSLDDVQNALLHELERFGVGERPVDNAWTVWLADRDYARLDPQLVRWAAVLDDWLVDRFLHRGLVPAGLVTVSFAAAAELEPGRFRPASQVRKDPPEVVVPPAPPPPPGRPRLAVPAGGEAPWGSPASAGIDSGLVLRPGSFVIGSAVETELRLYDPEVEPRHAVLEIDADGVVRLRDMGSRSGTLVDGVPRLEVELVDGNRIEMGATTLVFRRDPIRDDGGREGGELEGPPVDA
jgi:hypothetical protein